MADRLKPDVKLRYIEIDGVIVAGKPHPPDPPSWVEVSADFMVAMCAYGRKR